MQCVCFLFSFKSYHYEYGAPGKRKLRGFGISHILSWLYMYLVQRPSWSLPLSLFLSLNIYEKCVNFSSHLCGRSRGKKKPSAKHSSSSKLNKTSALLKLRYWTWVTNLHVTRTHVLLLSRSKESEVVVHRLFCTLDFLRQTPWSRLTRKGERSRVGNIECGNEINVREWHYDDELVCKCHNNLVFSPFTFLLLVPVSVHFLCGRG